MGYYLNMQWIGITGSWRNTPAKLQIDLAKTISQIISRGYGLVTGGALGVDYLAVEQWLSQKADLGKLKIFLPTDAKIYFKHYRNRAAEGIITSAQAENLILQLQTILKKLTRIP